MKPTDKLRKFFKEKTDPEIVDFMLFEIDNNLGVIYSDPNVEHLDNHCDQCRDEILVLKFRGPDEELPSYLDVSVGPTKFARIKSGWRESEGLDLKRVKFIT